MKRKFKVFLVLLSVFLVFHDVDTVNAANYRMFKFRMNITGSRVQESLPYYPTGRIALDDFIDSFRFQSGYSDIVDNTLYIYDFYLFINKTQYNGRTYTHSDYWRYNLLDMKNGLEYEVHSPLPSSFKVVYAPDVDIYPLYANWTCSEGFRYHNATGVKLYFTASLQLGANYYVNLGDVIQAVENVNSDVELKLDGVIESAEKINSSILDLKKQQSDFRDQDISSASGFEATGQKFVTDMQSTVKTKWAILFYPFEYSKQVIDVITNGTQSAYYKSYYNYVTGYHYDELTGGLMPIVDFSQPRLDERASGTLITFPAFTLPVLDLKIWDSFSFDLSTVKQQFPAVFNMMYLVAGIIETNLFVNFLRSKFDEIFGGDE
jgi:hypothetical protein